MKRQEIYSLKQKNQKNKIVKQVETFENEFENKNTITLEEINKTISGDFNIHK